MKISRFIRHPNSLTVLVTACDLDIARFNNKYNVIQWGETGVMPKNALIKEVANVDGLFCLLRDRIDAEILRDATKLRVISTLSAGYDHIDLEECKKRGIIVTNTPDVLTEVTAETTVTLLLATARRIPEAIDEAKIGKWSWSLYYMCGVGVHRSTVGIIGMGRIGLSVAQKLKAFNPARILYHNRKPNEKEAAKVGAEYVSLDELLKQSDFVILTCAYSPEMKELINEKTLSKMKENAILINSSRGGLINQEDLYKALSSGRIRAAGLDVTNPEPLPIDHPLFSLKNCVILPHIGSATELARTEMYHIAQDGILGVFDGSGPPENIRVV